MSKKGDSHAVIWQNMVKMSINCKIQMRTKPDFYSSPAHGTTYLSTVNRHLHRLWIVGAIDAELDCLLAGLISETTKQRCTNPRKTHPETIPLLSCDTKTKAVNPAALICSWRIISVPQDCILKHPSSKSLRWVQQHVNGRMRVGLSPEPKWPRNMIKKHLMYLEKPELTFGI